MDLFGHIASCALWQLLRFLTANAIQRNDSSHAVQHKCRRSPPAPSSNGNISKPYSFALASPWADLRGGVDGGNEAMAAPKDSEVMV